MSLSLNNSGHSFFPNLNREVNILNEDNETNSKPLSDHTFDSLTKRITKSGKLKFILGKEET